jgi:hypothetical protein
MNLTRSTAFLPEQYKADSSCATTQTSIFIENTDPFLLTIPQNNYKNSDNDVEEVIRIRP